MKPIVAIVGRPNVGKSTFFNRVNDKKKSIVEDRAGVTRDRIYADCEWNGCAFTLVDTGGLELSSRDEMYLHILSQAEIAIDTAEIILLFVDATCGISTEDFEVVSKLRKSNKPIFLVVNKVDNFKKADYFDYYSLGLEKLFPISSENGNGVADLLDALVESFSHRVEPQSDDDRLKIAIVGKPNAGKSSLANKILGFDRTIVSSISGTTRDSIDTDFDYEGQKYSIIDTAGIRRARSIDDDVEQYSVVRALASIRKADVCLVVIDCAEEISEQDLRIAGYVDEQGKPSIIVMNKWDLIEKDAFTINKFKQNLSTKLNFMSYYESIFLSAKTGLRVEKLLETTKKVYNNACFRATTGTLNEVIFDAISTNEPPTKSGRRLKIYYSTQVSTKPPAFVVFVNDSTLVHFSYKRYLENKLRTSFNLTGTPIKLIFRDKKDGEISK